MVTLTVKRDSDPNDVAVPRQVDSGCVCFDVGENRDAQICQAHVINEDGTYVLATVPACGDSGGNEIVEN